MQSVFDDILIILRENNDYSGPNSPEPSPSVMSLQELSAEFAAPDRPSPDFRFAAQGMRHRSCAPYDEAQQRDDDRDRHVDLTDP